ncbi:MAG TPA: tyrosine-type recombinase/integrase, partial [Methylomirabilota bacterium]|nr:tyrosine-type recombinase/integrase [Methylomirabilota bacterium]
ARTLRIQRAVTNDGRVKPPKTGVARTVDLSPRLTAALGAFQAALEADALVAGRDGIAPWVFAHTGNSRPQGGGTLAAPGTPIRPYQVGRLFDRLIRVAGLPHFRLYDLRHTFASHLIATGATVDYVSKQLGHASMAMTLTVYAHHFPKGDRQFIDRMAQVRAAAAPAPAPAADDATIPLSLETLADLNAGSWPRYGTAPAQLVESVETRAPRLMEAGYHTANAATVRRQASSPSSR